MLSNSIIQRSDSIYYFDFYIREISSSIETVAGEFRYSINLK